MDHILHRASKDKHKSGKLLPDKHAKHARSEHHKSLSSSHPAPSLLQPSPSVSDAVASLDIVIESPPCVFYGTPVNSTGALLSGRLRVNVPSRPPPASEPPAYPSATAPAPPASFLTLSNMRLRLVYTATTKKPVCKDCPDCSMRTEDLGRWEFLTEPIHLKPGAHDFPFSYLLPGHLPATTMGSLGTVEYSLRATASTSAGEHLPPLHMPLRISRAVLPGNDKTSVRIFPPTNLTGKVVLPSVVHPIGTFPVQMTLSGVVDTHETTQTRWRLRRLIWRIEEHQKLVSTACHRHTHKLSGEAAIAAGGPSHHETRIVGHGEEKAGWKSDFSTAGGEIYFEFDASLRPGCEPLCDIFPLLKEDGTTPMNPGALEVRHNLVIELIVAEEFVSLAAPGGPGAAKNCTPTGAARVLRMLFHLNVTERSGLGISWDEEMPPVYADVPPSPPTYAHEVEDEAQVGLTGPGVGSSSSGGGRGRQPPKLPPYARLERMDNSTLTPVQRPADTRPPGHSSRVPVDVSRGMPASMQHLAREDLELLEEDVAGFSLDDQGGPLHQALPHQQQGSEATPTVGEDEQVATQAPLRGPGESSASVSTSSASASASASNSAQNIDSDLPTTPKPIHPAPPHPPTDPHSPLILAPSSSSTATANMHHHHHRPPSFSTTRSSASAARMSIGSFLAGPGAGTGAGTATNAPSSSASSAVGRPSTASSTTSTSNGTSRRVSIAAAAPVASQGPNLAATGGGGGSGQRRMSSSVLSSSASSSSASIQLEPGPFSASSAVASEGDPRASSTTAGTGTGTSVRPASTFASAPTLHPATASGSGLSAVSTSSREQVQAQAQAHHHHHHHHHHHGHHPLLLRDRDPSHHRSHSLNLSVSPLVALPFVRSRSSDRNRDGSRRRHGRHSKSRARDAEEAEAEAENGEGERNGRVRETSRRRNRTRDRVSDVLGGIGRVVSHPRAL